MLTAIAVVLGLSALEVVTSSKGNGPSRFAQSLGALGTGLRWITDPTVPGIPNLKGATSQPTQALLPGTKPGTAPGGGNIGPGTLGEAPGGPALPGNTQTLPPGTTPAIA